MKKLIFSLTIGIFGLQACDQIDDPIPSDGGSSFSLSDDVEYVVDNSLNISSNADLLVLLNSNTWDTVRGADNTTQRFAVLEEFTGHKCRACPDGARKIKQLVDTFGIQLIPVAIHATDQFAAPEPNGTMFRSDYRVEGGHSDNYVNDLGIQALPQGLVSRTTSNGRQINQWESDFLAIKDDSPIARVGLTNLTSANDTLVRIQVEIEWLVASVEDYNLQVHLLESKIIDWQIDGNDVLPDYEHNFMLRKVVNGTYGKALKPVIAGSVETIEYITTRKSTWKPENMNAVVFVFDSDQNNGYEIIQANSAKLRP